MTSISELISYRVSISYKSRVEWSDGSPQRFEFEGNETTGNHFTSVKYFQLSNLIRAMASSRQVLLLSSSTVHGTEYLKYAENEINSFLKNKNVQRILFIPYALRNHDEYTNKIRMAFQQLGYEVDGIHKSSDPLTALNNAQALYVGGGNTFQLLNSLYQNGLVEPIRKKVLQEGLPYIGSSAGSNVATVSICTTNDMPIVYPPSFTALGLVPFNINPHFLDADPTSKHMGETREERIKQYQEVPGMPAVLGLREGCILHVDGNKATLKGVSGAKLFIGANDGKEYEVDSDLSFLLSTQ